jgi:hypothetical protein
MGFNRVITRFEGMNGTAAARNCDVPNMLASPGGALTLLVQVRLVKPVYRGFQANALIHMHLSTPVSSSQK